MAGVWILTADSEYARFLESSGSKGPLKELNTMVCASARQQEQELVSDRPGRSFGRAGGGRHSMESGNDAKHIEAERFAKEIADYLESALEKKMFSRIVFVAPPAFLGLLRGSISQRLKSTVSQEIDKNIVRMELSELRKHLPERI